MELLPELWQLIVDAYVCQITMKPLPKNGLVCFLATISTTKATHNKFHEHFLISMTSESNNFGPLIGLFVRTYPEYSAFGYFWNPQTGRFTNPSWGIPADVFQLLNESKNFFGEENTTQIRLCKYRWICICPISKIKQRKLNFCAVSNMLIK